MQMSQGTDFRMLKRETTDWKEGAESEYNSCSPKWCLRREGKKHWQNPVSAWCVPHVRVVGTVPLQLHKMCRVANPHVLIWGRIHTAWCFFTQQDPEKFSFPAIPGCWCWGISGWIWNKELHKELLAPVFPSSWELSLAQRALEQLWDALGEKGRWEPVWQTKHQGVWTLRSHHQSSSHLLLSAVSVGSKETLWYKCLKK